MIMSNRKVKFDSQQKRTISEIFVDIGKLFFAGGVIGFFIPGIGGKISTGSFVITLIGSIIFFMIGIILAKKQKYYEF